MFDKICEEIKKRREELEKATEQLRQVENLREDLVKRILAIQGALAQLEELKKEATNQSTESNEKSKKS